MCAWRGGERGATLLAEGVQGRASGLGFWICFMQRGAMLPVNPPYREGRRWGVLLLWLTPGGRLPACGLHPLFLDTSTPQDDAPLCLVVGFRVYPTCLPQCSHPPPPPYTHKLALSAPASTSHHRVYGGTPIVPTYAPCPPLPVYACVPGVQRTRRRTALAPTGWRRAAAPWCAATTGRARPRLRRPAGARACLRARETGCIAPLSSTPWPWRSE